MAVRTATVLFLIRRTLRESVALLLIEGYPGADPVGRERRATFFWPNGIKFTVSVLTHAPLASFPVEHLM